MSLYQKRTPDQAHQIAGNRLARMTLRRERLNPKPKADTTAWTQPPRLEDPQRITSTQEQPPSAREIQVLELIAHGLTNNEIAKELFLSPETVKSHVRHLLAKLEAANRAHAVGIAYRQGLLSIGSLGR